jgi:Protein of unknown function (DUF4242)
MELVIVERTFEEPADLDALHDAEARAHWCLELHNVRFVRSYISSDRRRMICMYEAPDAEAVRIVNSTSKNPFDRVWSASLLGSE